MKLVAEMASDFEMMSNKLAQVDGARIAHRHLLGEFLASLDNERVITILDNLQNQADHFEHAMGEHRIAGYRSELDTLLGQSREIRNKNK